MKTVPAVAAVLALSGCGVLLATGTEATAGGSAATIYFGGDIVTMRGEKPEYVEALVVRDGKIAFVGPKAQAEKQAGLVAPRRVNLHGHTLLPGFVDGHSHLLMYADSLGQANLSPPPVGTVRSIGDIVRSLRDLKEQAKADDQALLVGFGYDPDALAEHRHPTAEDLDAAFPSNPVVLRHVSGHMAVANSAALRLAGISADTPDPAGGVIARKPGTREPAGLLQESALLPLAARMQQFVSPDAQLALLEKAQADYAAAGLTTANEGAVFSPQQMSLLADAARQGKLRIDVVALPLFIMAKELVGTGRLDWGVYHDRLKYQGLKLVLDGSPQGKTAYLTHPYLTPVPGCEHDCRGFPNIDQDTVNRLVTLAYTNGVQVFAHCNGDAAVDMMVAAHEFAERRLGEQRTDRRTVIVHSQAMRREQLDAYKKYGFFPTFFTNHTYYWGDVHIANLGPERAAAISPTHTAALKGLRFANHTDAPVTPPDQLFLLWTSVNRVSRSGQVVGADERVDAYRGLQALTIDGAREYFEEQSKGTLEPGKLADLVVLDRNPLKVAALAIKDIHVLETLKEGRTIYARSAAVGGQ